MGLSVKKTLALSFFIGMLAVSPAFADVIADPPSGYKSWPHSYQSSCKVGATSSLTVSIFGKIHSKKAEIVAVFTVNDDHAISLVHTMGSQATLDFAYTYFNIARTWVKFDMLNAEDEKNAQNLFRDLLRNRLGVSKEEIEEICLFDGANRFASDLLEKAGETK